MVCTSIFHPTLNLVAHTFEAPRCYSLISVSSALSKASNAGVMAQWDASWQVHPDSQKAYARCRQRLHPESDCF